MTEIKCIVVDDEIIARKSLSKLCEKVEQLSVIGVFESGKNVLACLEKEEVDLIFLDIEMPDMTGLDLIEQLPYLPQIIFTTSNQDYAYAAFEYDVTDFLKKPVTMSRFLKAIEKVQTRKSQLNAVADSSASSEIYIRVDGRLVRLPYEDIYYFENVGDYIKVVSVHGNFIFHSTIKALNQKIKNPRFLKVHRSYIVNLNKIKDIEDSTLVIDQKVIPISRSHRPVILRSINLI